jgi:hypothetical protein
MPKSNGKKASALRQKKTLRDPVPERFASVEEEVEFWENHDLTEYQDYFREVKDVKIDLPSRRFNLEEELAGKINRVARRRGVSFDVLIHLWLQQKLAESQKREQRRRASSRIAMAAR